LLGSIEVASILLVAIALQFVVFLPGIIYQNGGRQEEDENPQG